MAKSESNVIKFYVKSSSPRVHFHVHPQTSLVQELLLTDVAFIGRVLVSLHMMTKITPRHFFIAKTANDVLGLIWILIWTDVVLIILNALKSVSTEAAILVIGRDEGTSLLRHHAAVLS